MDIETVDQGYRQLQNQAEQTIQALSALGQKLREAAQGGDPNAREWQLDLREIALQIQQEQADVTGLLQSIHGFVANQVQQQPVYQQPAYQQPAYQQSAYQQPAPRYADGGGGGMRGFLGSGFGRAIAQGAGFGIGDDLINHIFGR